MHPSQKKKRIPADGEWDYNANTYGKASKYCNKNL